MGSSKKTSPRGRVVSHADLFRPLETTATTLATLGRCIKSLLAGGTPQRGSDGPPIHPLVRALGKQQAHLSIPPCAAALSSTEDD